MTERNDVPRTWTSPLQPAVQAPHGTPANLADRLQSLPPVTAVAGEEAARERIAAYEREAKALGADPAAATLFYEIGLLFEEALKNPRSAAVAYQNAYRLAPRFLPNLRAARRLFAEVGNWQMVVQLLDAELGAVSSASERACLLAEKASVLQTRLSRDEDAAAVYAACLDQAPTDLAVLLELEAAFARRDDLPNLAKVYPLLAAAVKSDAWRAQYLTAQGLLLQDRLGRPEEGAQALRQAFALERKNPVLVAAVALLAEKEGAGAELLTALAGEAELAGKDAAPIFLRMSKVYAQLSRHEDALASLLAARRVRPDDPLVLSELARIYETQQRYEDLADVLKSWAQCVADEAEQVALNLRLAALYEDHLRRDEEAVAGYSAVLQRVPGQPAAVTALGRLYYRLKNWVGLVSVFDAEIAVAPDARQKVSRLFKTGEILADRLGRFDEAAARYQQCLQILPGYLPAQKALVRLFEQQGRQQDLIALYEQDLVLAADNDAALDLLHRIATLAEERLHDVDRAIEALARAAELKPDHLPTLRKLAALYERTGRWRELLRIHDAEAACVGDMKAVLTLLHRSAEIVEEQLKDVSGAIEAYQKLLALAPSYLPALKALGRLFAQERRWEDLVQMYRAEAEISTSNADAAILVFKVAELCEQKLKDTQRAIDAYREVLELSPSYFPALRALARIHREQQDWEKLIEVLKAEADSRTHPAERASPLFEAAAICEENLGRAELAIAGYQEVLRLAPGHPAAIRALERLYANADDVRGLIGLLDHQTQTASDPGFHVAAYLKLARLYLDRLDQPAKAAQCCESALELDGDNLFATKLLERIRATEPARRAEATFRVAERATDPELKAGIRLAVAAAGDPLPDAALAELRQSFLENPGDARLAGVLERAFRRAGDFRALAALIEKRIEVATEADQKLELKLRAADVWEVRLEDPARALSAFRAAESLQEGHLVALEGIRRCALKLGDFGSARAALEQIAARLKDPRGAVEAFNAAARLSFEQLRDAEGAVANFQRALQRDPLDPTATAGLEELLNARGGAADLALLQERRAEAKLAQRDPGAAATDFFSAASTWLKAGDSDRAAALLERTLTAHPNHLGALELKTKLALDAGRFADAASAMSLRVQQGGEAQSVAELHLRLGALYQDHLQDASRAAAHLQTCLKVLPDQREALGRLAVLHTESKNWTSAADCQKRLLALVSEPAVEARHTLALAQIVEEGFADLPQAAELYRRALDLSPNDPAIFERLLSLYQRIGRLAELAEVLELRARAEPDPAARAGLLVRLGEMALRPGGDPKRAVERFRQAVELAPQDTQARAQLADLLAQDPAAAPLAIEQHRALLAAAPGRVESLKALKSLWTAQRQPDRAFCASGLLHFLKDDSEAVAYEEAASRVPELKGKLEPGELEQLLHPDARGPLLEVLRAIGDQLSRLYEPRLEALGVDPKNDRLKPSHAVARAIRPVADAFGLDEVELFLSRRGVVTLELTDPLCLCIGQDAARRFSAREQRFLIGRGVFGLWCKSAVVSRLPEAELGELLGAAVRIHVPSFTGLGRRNDELTKRLKKACSRKALKALEGPANALAGTRDLDLRRTVAAVDHSANRAGLVACGDVAASLSALIRGDVSVTTVRAEGASESLEALRTRPDCQALVAFALSDPHFALRRTVGTATA